jgi:F0F1-type ATP synthase assembly protein I
MTSIKPFIVGALFGTFVSATFLGATSHLLVIALVVLGAGAAILRGRRHRVSERIANRAVKP